jgi:hypothetical protein
MPAGPVITVVAETTATYQRAELDHRDVLSTLLAYRDEDGRALSQTEINGQITMMLVAGIETTTAAMVWALHLLSMHPDIQRRVQTESRDFLNGRVASWDDLPKLGLASRVVSEALRLYPPTVIVTRERYHRGLRRVFYLAALSSIKPDGPSWTFYQRKRAQGKIHTQALIALARRLVDVVWAVMRDQREFQTTAPLKALAAA